MTDLMPAIPADAQSLADFARTKSPAALGAIVRRYVDLVYATARRLVGDSHLADDVTQYSEGSGLLARISEILRSTSEGA